MRQVIWFVLLLALLAIHPPAGAQTITRGQQGVPPIASLISVSQPDARGIVTVSGQAGAVFPNAQVAVRNLYTGETVYTTAGITGSFNVTLYGPSTTPFWISAAPNIPPALRNVPGSLPGGPGTIINGGQQDTAFVDATVTRLVIDADLRDWDEYPSATLNPDVFALTNDVSLYLAIRDDDLNTPFAEARLNFNVSGAVYDLRVFPGRTRSISVTQITPTRRDRGEFAANVAFGDGVLELRTSARALGDSVTGVTLVSLRLLDESGAELVNRAYAQPVPKVNEIDGVVYPGGRLGSDARRFYVAGPLGASYWAANGRSSRLRPAPGDEVTLELDVTFFAPDLPLETGELRFSGELSLQPVFVAGADANNGWSNVRTISGLAVDNLRGDVALGRAESAWDRVIRYSDRIVFGLRFVVTLPADLPPGVYVPLFDGFLTTQDGITQTWAESALFGGARPGMTRTRLPVVWNIGAVETQRLPWALFYDDPSDGSRGILPVDVAEGDLPDDGVLSNRVRFNSPTYILPPGSYPVEPYLLNVTPNSYTLSAPPLIPFLYPGGRLTADITRPDGTAESLGSVPVLQSRLSTDALDERTRWGAQSPVNVYRLTTLVSQYTGYNFDQYGEYRIDLTGTAEDFWGNRYAGGGIYRLLIAEPLDLTPGVLPGTPFEVGDRFYPGVTLAPALPAEVTVTLNIHPLDGSPVVTQTVTGRANRYGYFMPGDRAAFDISAPGEYVVDYEARYTDSEGRLWAASLRGAGVIARPDGDFIARGRRGLDGAALASDDARPAWYTLRSYLNDRSVTPRLNMPYHAGDIAYYTDTPTSGIRPIMQVQDTASRYTDWLRGTIPGFVSSGGQDIETLARRSALPLVPVLGGAESPYQPALFPQLMVNQAYGYVSVVTPGVSVRQFVHGSDADLLPLWWDASDPLNRQIGAGADGLRVRDYAFMFGGAVIRNAEAGVQDSAIYAALSVVIPDNDPYGVRVFPPYQDAGGGMDAGALLRLRGRDYTLFFHPTGTLPGQALVVGDTLSIAGQVAPTLPSRVAVQITSPSGAVTTFDGLTNAIGYFYQPQDNLTVREVGVWRVRITATPAGMSSIGEPEPPLPSGGVPGAISDEYVVYVTQTNAESLRWNRGGDINDRIPPASLINFTLTVPPGWTNVTAYRTLTMPGYILDDGALRSITPAAYQYSPPQIALEFPLEATGRGDGNAASRVVTLTFAITGTDSEGRRQIATRTFTIMHDRLYSFEGP